MTRTRIIEEYESKKQGILDTAAELFARVGYSNAKMADIAKACGGSKSMLYHYFRKKDDVLFAMLKEYLENLIATAEAVSTDSGSPQDRFNRFINEYIDKSHATRTRNLVALYDVRFLPKRQRVKLIELERRVADLVSGLLQKLNPSVPQSHYKPYALLLFGMLNMTDVWFNPSGPISTSELCERVNRLFLHGFLSGD